MLIKKTLSLHLSQEDFIIGVVQAQLIGSLVVPRGFHIVKHRIRPAELEDIIPLTDVASLIPFDNLYVWDISQNEALRDFFTHMVKGMTDWQFRRLMEYFEIPLGLNDSFTNFTYLEDLEIKIQVQKRELNLQHEALQEKIQICKLWILSELTVEQISDTLMCSRRKVETIISNFRRRNYPAKLYSMIQRYEVRKCLLDSLPLLLRQFTTSYSEKSLHEIFDSLSQVPEFAKHVSFRSFEMFLKKDLGICFTRLKTIKSSVDAPRSKELRRTLSLVVMKLMAEGHLVLFFDESLISETSFRSKVWKLRKTKYVHLDHTNIAGTMNILLLASVDRVWNFWMTKKINSETIISFLEESIQEIRSDRGNILVFLFLDNCPSHRTIDMRLFASKAKVILIYNVIYSSKINPIEYLFEVIKRYFRQRVCKGYRENLHKTLLIQLLRLKPLNLRISFMRAFKEMKACIDYKNMWINL